MNFLNFLTAGASLFNFNLQNLASSSSSQPHPSPLQKSPQQLPPLTLTSTSDLNTKMKQQMEVLSHQQQLINQYMHLNIQLLSQKLENLEKIPNQDRERGRVGAAGLAGKEENNSQEGRNLQKKNKKINKCGHDDKQHYAKGLCNNCYHKYGRTKKPWNCPHQKLYAAGMCQNCYINNYNKKKRLTRDGVQTDQFDHQLKIEQSQNSQIVSQMPEKFKKDMKIQKEITDEKDQQKGNDRDREREMEMEKGMGKEDDNIGRGDDRVGL